MRAASARITWQLLRCDKGTWCGTARGYDRLWMRGLGRLRRRNPHPIHDRVRPFWSSAPGVIAGAAGSQPRL